jgi:hypothetical protein
MTAEPAVAGCERMHLQRQDHDVVDGTTFSRPCPCKASAGDEPGPDGKLAFAEAEAVCRPVRVCQ